MDAVDSDEASKTGQSHCPLSDSANLKDTPVGVRIDGTGATSAENTTGAVEQDYNRESSYTYI
jgi:hypothetical protein